MFINKKSSNLIKYKHFNNTVTEETQKTVENEKGQKEEKVAKKVKKQKETVEVKETVTEDNNTEINNI